ncbi:MAG: HD domain-containing protein [bacterium]|nr:HD domain-containing protein [bacterium]
MAPEGRNRDSRHFLKQALEVIRQLAPLIRNSYFHDLSNAVFREPMQQFLAALQPLVEAEDGFTLERLGQGLFANGTRIPQRLRTAHAYSLVSAEFEKQGLGGMRLLDTVSNRDLRGLLSLLAGVRAGGAAEASELNQRLKAAGIDNIELLPPRAEVGGTSDRERPNLRERALHTYKEVLDFIQTTFTDLDSPGQLNQRRAKRLVQKLVDLSGEEAEGFSLFGLAAIKDHDRYTFNHMVNVCVLAIAFGQRLGLSRQDLAELGLSALYHDLGKLNIPLEVLNKPAKLNAKEWALMGNHTVYGTRALFPLLQRDLRAVPRLLAVLQHHHGFSGEGYPKLRLLKSQNLFARIIAVVDLFDAMTTKRVYQEECLPDEALRTMHSLAGKYCDPLVAKAFTNCIGIFPVGSTVELASNRLAVVVKPNSDPDRPDRPTVRVVTDPSQQPAEPYLLDLATPEAADQSIRGCVDPDLYGLNPAYFAI